MKLVSAVPIDVYVHFWGPSNIVHPNAPLALKEWDATEFAVLDLDGNLVTFFEFKDASR